MRRRRRKTAFRLGEEKRDHILMARARLLLCMIENARVEEGIGESTEPGSHARLAQDCAQEAIELAKHTQNRRLLAHTYVWQGLTYCNRFFDDPEAARRCYDQAITLTKGDHADSAWEDLQTLKAKVLPRRQRESYAARLVARIRRRQDFPADQRGIRRTDHSQSLGAGGPQGFARGGPPLGVTEKSPPHSQPRGTDEAAGRVVEEVHIQGMNP